MASSRGDIINPVTGMELTTRINKGTELTWTEADNNFKLLEQSLKLSAGFYGNAYYGYIASITAMKITTVSNIIDLNEEFNTIRQNYIDGTDTVIPLVIAKKGNTNTEFEATDYNYNGNTIPDFVYVITDTNFNLIVSDNEWSLPEGGFNVPNQDFYLIDILLGFETQS